MRIDGAGNFEEIQRSELRRSSKKERKQGDEAQSSGESQVVKENVRALTEALNNKEFEVNVEKVKQIKEELERGEYRIDAREIAKRIIISEQKGTIKLGLFNSEPQSAG